MIEYIGISPFNWQELIGELQNQIPIIGPKHTPDDNIKGLDEVTSMWDKAGYYKRGTVGWDMFYPGEHFDYKIAEQFAEWSNLKSFTNAWISRIHPGFFAPIHWDVQDNEPLPDTVRYHVHMSKPQFGHIFIAEDACLYNQQQGATYKWTSRKAWHAGTNCGIAPKYIFNIW